ncbi:MAG: InlB B-repeat-containing protein [Bacillus subtilis]|nr:InlB B-repeat-containing protein [Bacillus subtilis]
MPAQNITLYAKWNINSYTLEFKDHDGTVLQSALFAYGASLAAVTAPADPTRTGYTFTGWSASIPATMPANDVTITAQYSINSYALEFKDHDGTVLQSALFAYGASLAAVTCAGGSDADGIYVHRLERKHPGDDARERRDNHGAVHDQQLHHHVQFQWRQRRRLDHPELWYRGHATGRSDEDGIIRSPDGTRMPD